MMRQASEFQAQVTNRGLVRWDIYQCSICGSMCGYVFAAGRVYYDSSCDCVPYASTPQPRTWQEVADFYNSRRDPEGIARMDAFWGFGLVDLSMPPGEMLENSWIPVATQLPPRSGHYPIIHSHVSSSGYTIRKQWYARYALEDGLWHDLQDDTDVRWSKVVTHWFDLPKVQEIDPTAPQPVQDEVAHAYNY